MDMFLITFRSVTPAQRGEMLLRREGISCNLQRTPRVLAEQGCGYSLRLPGNQLPKAGELLRQNGIAYRTTYRLGAGEPVEVAL